MCGIIGYLGKEFQDASRVLLRGLWRLEYRGYDSAGLATVDHDHRLHLRRTTGGAARLATMMEAEPAPGSLGIAHTRWATHGRATGANAHPHLDATGRIALVHNGILENHAPLRTFLEQQGIPFRSETDTESLVQLIGHLFQQTDDFEASVRAALREIQGAFAIAAICTEEPQTLIAARRGSPVIIGVGSHPKCTVPAAIPPMDV